MPNIISRIAEVLKLKKPLARRGGLAITEEGKLASTPNIEELQKRRMAPSDSRELGAYLNQTHHKAALVSALRKMQMPVTKENLRTANIALSLQAMARTRAQKAPGLGFNTSLEEAFKNALRRANLRRGKK